MENLDNAVSFLETFPFWEHLSTEEKELTRANLHIAQYNATEAVRSSKSDCLGTLFIRKGILRAYLLSSEGREATIFRLHEGDVCLLSASCILSDITFEIEIDAETDCELIVIPPQVYSTLMKQNIYVENFSYRIITERFSDLISAVERMYFFNLKQRIAAFLIDESSEQRTDELELTHEQVAKAIGSAREAVSRSLKQLSASGCIEATRGTILILDRKQLYIELEG